MAHPDMDALLDEALNTAVHFLEKNGEFFPFGVTMPRNGETNHSQGYTGEEQPPSQEVIDLLVSAFVRGAEEGEYKATALVSDVRVSLDGANQTDAVCVTIEHVDDEPVTCFFPYVNQDETFEFEELVAERAERQIFHG